MYMPNALLQLSVVCGEVGRSNKHFNVWLSHRLFTSSNKVSSHNPAANVEILYILPSLRLSLYLTTHNIIYTRAKMHSAIHQPTTTAPPHLEDLEMAGAPFRATNVTNTTTRDGATAEDMAAAGEGTAAEEAQKKGVKLTKTGSYWDLARARREQEIQEEARKRKIKGIKKVAYIIGGCTCGFVVLVVVLVKWGLHDSQPRH
jgi:hypothetical protein